MKFIALPSVLGALTMLSAAQMCLAQNQPPAPPPSGEQTDGPFRKVILESDAPVDGKLMDTLKDPMELAVAPDGRVFYAQRDGTVKLIKLGAKEAIILAKLPVFTGLEDGMLGITLDPKFAQNGWVYLNRSLPETIKDEKTGGKAGIIRVSRFTLKGDTLDLASETKILDVQTQRETCCHVGGSLAFDKDGNLYMSVGDNTNPFESDGYSPSDERPGRYPWDAQRSSANANSLVGKILRVKPKAEGGYEIPKGNLFPPGTPGTRPEIFVMGNRNPFRISVDAKTGYLYWGEVGPDAGSNHEKRGPAGNDEINQARKAGFFGWPLFVGDNRPYARVDFKEYQAAKDARTAYDKAAKEAKAKNQPAPAKPTFPEFPTGEPKFHDPLKPLNLSINNDGIKELPPAQPAFIYYTHVPSTRFPAVNGGGGRTAMAGPVYYYDPNHKNPHRLPKEFDRTLFIYEWSRNWIVTVKLDENSNIVRDAAGKPVMDKFCPKMTFKRPMDLELGADGCLYLIEWGTAWGNNKDTQIVRIEFSGTQTAAK
jgi:cytochrome c